MRDGSPPARVAWIETPLIGQMECSSRVATREGGVDRNTLVVLILSQVIVATREGGVDRNFWTDEMTGEECKVATREGGVDRNTVELMEVK